jgi:hypothetical protein
MKTFVGILCIVVPVAAAYWNVIKAIFTQKSSIK